MAGGPSAGVRDAVRLRLRALLAERDAAVQAQVRECVCVCVCMPASVCARAWRGERGAAWMLVASRGGGKRGPKCALGTWVEHLGAA
jgi:hypothetical protein